MRKAVSILRISVNVFRADVSDHSLQLSSNAQRLITRMDEPSRSRRAENCRNQDYRDKLLKKKVNWESKRDVQPIYLLLI